MSEVKEYRVPVGEGYMEALQLAEEKGWVYAYFKLEHTNGQRFENIGKLGGGKWNGNRVYVGENVSHDLVIDYGNRLVVIYGDDFPHKSKGNVTEISHVNENKIAFFK